MPIQSSILDTSAPLNSFTSVTRSVWNCPLWSRDQATGGWRQVNTSGGVLSSEHRLYAGCRHIVVWNLYICFAARFPFTSDIVLASLLVLPPWSLLGKVNQSSRIRREDLLVASVLPVPLTYCWKWFTITSASLMDRLISLKCKWFGAALWSVALFID